MKHHIVAGASAFVVIDRGRIELVRPGPYITRRDAFKRIEFRAPVTVKQDRELVVITDLGHMEVFT